MTEARIRGVGAGWAVVLLLVFLALAAAVQGGSLRFSDHLLLTIAQAPGSPALDDVMAAVSAIATIEVTSVLVVVLALTARSARPLGWSRWVPVLVFAVAALVELGAKTVIHQTSPSGYLLRGPRLPGLGPETAYSFPSGHMVRITLVLGLAAMRLARRTRQVTWLWLCVAAVWIVGFSRVYLGEHWPADVAGGILLGGAALSVCMAISPRAAVGDVDPGGGQP